MRPVINTIDVFLGLHLSRSICKLDTSNAIIAIKTATSIDLRIVIKTQMFQVSNVGFVSKGQPT